LTDQAVLNLDQLNLSSNLNNQLDCEAMSHISTETQLNQSIDALFKAQEQLIEESKAIDRHQIGQLFNQCEADSNSKGLIINFEGTGSYEPRAFDIQQKLIKCIDPTKFDKTLTNYFYHKFRVGYKKAAKLSPKWSAISAGPMDQMLFNSSLATFKNNYQITSFPSEETELLARDDAFTLEYLKKIPSEYISSSNTLPKGILNALKCTVEYMASAKKKNIEPKIIVQSHSSGGRSAVKFLEHLKKLPNPVSSKTGIEVDLVFSIDPVKEAHEAVKEVLSQMAGNLVREDKPVNVWTRKQPESLYKPSNAKRWVNVYQNVDTDGLKGAVKFGIRGSPIENADKNFFIKEGLKNDAHGAIAKHTKTLELYAQELAKFDKK